MGRLWAATRVVALFLSALFPVAMVYSPVAQACEACERVPLSPETVGRIDVTTAVDTASSFIVKNTSRGWRWLSSWGETRPEVEITQLDVESAPVADISNGREVAATLADYIAAYEAGEFEQSARMPSFRREHKWALTYRSDAADALPGPGRSERFPGMNTTLDDSVVVGLRFEWDYGWTR